MDIVNNMTDLLLNPIPITRKQAAALNLRYYLQTKPCLNGHIAPRSVKTRVCRECNLAHAKVSYNKNKLVTREYKPRERKYDISTTGCYLEHYPDNIIKYIQKQYEVTEQFDAAGSWARASRVVSGKTSEG